jgi:phage terminase small subunit
MFCAQVAPKFANAILFSAQVKEVPVVEINSRRRWERFAEEYVIDLNGTRAAIRAGYSAKGAKVTASRLLTKANVKADIDRYAAKHSEKLEISATRVLRELALLAFLDPRKFYNDDGSLKPVTELDEGTAASIAGIVIETLYENEGSGRSKAVGTITKIRFADKGQNLERLGRHLKLFTDKIELTGEADLIARLAAGRERLQLDSIETIRAGLCGAGDQ